MAVLRHFWQNCGMHKLICLSTAGVTHLLAAREEIGPFWSLLVQWFNIPQFLSCLPSYWVLAPIGQVKAWSVPKVWDILNLDIAGGFDIVESLQCNHVTAWSFNLIIISTVNMSLTWEELVCRREILNVGTKKGIVSCFKAAVSFHCWGYQLCWVVAGWGAGFCVTV